MIPLRRSLGAALLAALVALASLAIGSCTKNDLTGQGLDRYILPKGAGPQGTYDNPDSTWKWAVNSIDSVVFTDNIDSTTLEVTSFQLADSLGNIVPGTVRFMPGNEYIYYTQPFPGTAFDFYHKPGEILGTTLAKVYFVPAGPLHGHMPYTYTLTTGVRLVSGRLRRDVRHWSFTTGDSVPPPNPIWLP